MYKFIKMDITTIITEAIEKHTPISFSKYGDGEYYCSNSMGIRNCDHDNYTETKKIALIESFKYMVDNMLDYANIKNGSFKIYVHNGKPGVRIEIQNKVIAEI